MTLNNGLRILTDPAFAEKSGLDLAAQAEELGVDFVAAWYEPESAILAHIVARALGTAVVSAENSEGIIELLEPVAAGGHGLLVANSFNRTNSVRGLIGAIANAGSTVAGIAVLTRSAALDEAEADLPVFAVSDDRQ